jgi:hypothetical protein
MPLFFPRVLHALSLFCISLPALAVEPIPAGASFQWQLDGAFNASMQAQVYDLDLFETPASTVAAIKARGAQAICYISVGTLENGRPDAASFPAAAVGAVYPQWPNERWLDIRRIDLIGPAMLARLDLCRDKGFDGVEPDNVDAYQQENTGFTISEADQIAYLRWLSEQAHARGLSIGLKNVPDLAERMEPLFDWALTEDCFVQGWCAQLASFIVRNKAVFVTEYSDTAVNFRDACAVLNPEGFTPIYKHRNLDAYRRTCQEFRRRIRSRPLPVGRRDG